MTEPENLDDKSIGNEAELWRRVPPDQLYLEYDGTITPSTQAFSYKAMSVVLAEQVSNTKRTPEELLVEFQKYGMAAITAGNARNCNQIVYPKPEHDEPAHAEVYGNKTKRVRRLLREEAVSRGWVVPPPNPSFA